MTVLYVDTQGAVVQQEAERILVTQRDRVTRRRTVLQSAPVHTLEQVVLLGRVQITTQAATLLLRHAVEVVFLTRRGHYVGRLAHDGARGAQVRLRQLRLASDPRQSLAVATQIVQAKLRRQQAVLAQLAHHTPAAQTAAAGVEQMCRACVRAGTLDSLRGFEGKGSALYFGLIRQLLDPVWGFHQRAYHPPPDPVNALFSFGYGLLAKDMERVVQLIGLDPYLGFLHSAEDNRPSLVLDLMEEFRPLWVDWAVLNLLLGGKLQPSDFSFTGRAEQPVLLGAGLMPRLIEAYETRGDDRVYHQPSRTYQRIRFCLEMQARRLEQVVLGTQPAYEGIG